MLKNTSKNLLKKALFLILFLVVIPFSLCAEQFEDIRKELTTFKVNQKSIDTFIKGIKAATDNRNFTESKNLYLKAIELDKNNHLAYDYLAHYYMYIEHNNQKAVESFNNAIKANPKVITSYINLALLYLNSGNHSEAAKLYNKAISLFPEHPEGYYGIAVINFKAENYRISLENSLKAVKLYDKPVQFEHQFGSPENKALYKADAQLIAIYSYLYSGDISNAYNYFANIYSDMKKINYPPLSELINSLKEANNLIKSSNNNLYQENLKILKRLNIK